MCGYEKSAHLYDLFDRKDKVGFFLRYGTEVGEILDVGAGTGRIAIPLAENGVRVVCVEPSPSMRREFRKKLEKRPDLQRRVKLVSGDAESFELKRWFPAAFLSGTFDHFRDSAQRRASLENVVRHLEPGGKLIFDVFLGMMDPAPLSPAGRVEDGEWESRRLVGRQVVPRQRVNLVYEVYHNAECLERIEEESVVGVTSREEVHALLREVDCAVLREFASYDLAPFRSKSDMLIVEAVRQPGRRER